jgi:2-phospho-L-lactate guanylyltransferase (CobY/MobA/RfbA family)
MVSALPDNAEIRAAVLAPDRYDNGTNALLIQPAEAAPFAFGRGSFARHCMLVRQAGIEPVIVHNPRLAFDVDTWADVERLRSLGIWTPRESRELSAFCTASEGGHL